MASTKKTSGGSGSRSALLAFCRSLPMVTEDIKWGNDLMFSIGKKIFAGFSASGTDASFSCKVAEDEFPLLTSMRGILPAPYAARYHWVAIEDGALPTNEATTLIRGSYDLVKAGLPKKLQAQIDGDVSSETRRPSETRRSSETKAKTAKKTTSPKAAKKKKASLEKRSRRA